MDFHRVLTEVGGQLDSAKIRYALIGGFAMAMRGVQRATVDLDLLLLLEDMEKAHSILQACGYERCFHSDNVSHYTSQAANYGRIDILHAFRGPSLGMLERAERLAITEDIIIPVVQAEDIIGLKIQAGVNDPERAKQDWLDIQSLLTAAAHHQAVIDWALIQDYLAIFDLQDRLSDMRQWYGKTD